MAYFPSLVAKQSDFFPLIIYNTLLHLLFWDSLFLWPSFLLKHDYRPNVHVSPKCYVEALVPTVTIWLSDPLRK